MELESRLPFPLETFEDGIGQLLIANTYRTMRTGIGFDLDGNPAVFVLASSEASEVGRIIRLDALGGNVGRLCAVLVIEPQSENGELPCLLPIDVSGDSKRVVLATLPGDRVVLSVWRGESSYKGAIHIDLHTGQSVPNIDSGLIFDRFALYAKWDDDHRTMLYETNNYNIDALV
jgi:hypothetical protein